MKKLLSWIFVMLLFAVPSFANAAQHSALSDDVDAMNDASQSIVLLSIYGENDSLIATGSGFFAWDAFTIVTNYHVIEDAYRVVATTENDISFPVPLLLAYDPERDLAILGAEDATDVQPLTLADSSTTRKGEKVVAIGSPLGLKNTFSTGIVSAIDNSAGYEQFLFSAPISQGSSGGALFNESGQVIGITSAILSDGQNLNIAISVNTIKSLRESNTASTSILDHYKQTKKQRIPTITDGVLTVATSADFPPYCYIGSNGTLTGIEIDIIESTTKQLSLDVSYVILPFEDTWGALSSSADCIVNGTEYTSERLRIASPTISYATINDPDGDFYPVFYVDRDNRELLSAINGHLFKMQADGLIDQIVANYF